MPRTFHLLRDDQNQPIGLRYGFSIEGAGMPSGSRIVTRARLHYDTADGAPIPGEVDWEATTEDPDNNEAPGWVHARAICEGSDG